MYLVFTSSKLSLIFYFVYLKWRCKLAFGVCFSLSSFDFFFFHPRIHTINCLRDSLKHWLHGIKSALSVQGMAVVFVSCLVGFRGKPWGSCHAFMAHLPSCSCFVFKKCLLSSNIGVSPGSSSVRYDLMLFCV